LKDDLDDQLDQPFIDKINWAVDTGATVGQFRRHIAELMNVSDHNRIVFIARDGMRTGLIQGDAWEFRNIRDWLCTWLSIDVVREDGYVALEGLDRSYIFHPEPAHMSNTGLTFKQVKQCMVERLFKRVHRSGGNNIDIRWSSITCSSRGRKQDSSSRVEWGRTYKFSIPVDGAESIANIESWLLPKTKTCSVCSDDKSIADLPLQITEACSHDVNICKDCTRQWIHSSMESNTWDKLKCPECPSFMKFHDVKRNASREDFTRFDELVLRDAVKNIANFRWCLSPTCKSGQIHDATCPKFSCKACKARHCVDHDVPWHRGETCAEYDKRNRKRQKDEKASEDTIKKTTKNCPRCKKAVHKWTGCNHITCKSPPRGTATLRLHVSSSWLQ
jgi:hypothetical protein